MPESHSASLDLSEFEMRTIVGAYVHSNVFFPQVRFSFVLCMCIVLDLSIFRNIMSGQKIVISLKSEKIIKEKADRIHSANHVNSVVPTNLVRIREEINQSLIVFKRSIYEYFNLFECEIEKIDENDMEMLINSANDLWKVCVSENYSRDHIAFLSGVEDYENFPVRKVPIMGTSTTKLLEHLKESVGDNSSRRLLSILEPEMLHHVTVMRPNVATEKGG
jgi:hypothetical protein